MNSIRSCNFMLKDSHPGKCAYFGCIGKDEFGDVLDKTLKDSGMHSYLHRDESEKTGTCGVVVHNKERSLIANLAACTKYPLSHYEQNVEVFKKAAFIYTTAFFITSNNDALLAVLKLAKELNKPVGFNLSAPFLIQFNTK